MNNKTALKYLAVLVFLGVIAFSAYKSYKQGIDAGEKNNTSEEANKGEDTKEEKPVETSKEYILLTREVYKDSYRTTIRLYSTGKLEQSTIKEEATINSSEKEKFINIGSASEEELNTIKETINKMSKEEFKEDNLSEGYGITIKLNPKDKILYNAEYFNQKDVDTIYNIIKNY